MIEPAEGQRYTRADGAEVRIDRVKGGEVYCVAWLPGQERGRPTRRPVGLFLEAIRREGMVLA
jgi:hypothetical protein